MRACEEVPLPGIRGRLLSELGKKGGGCWGRVDADCEDCEDCTGGGAGRGAGTEGGGARAVWGRVSGVGLAAGRSGSRLPGITVPRSYSEKSKWDVVTFMLACFRSGVFIVTKVGFNESGNLDQVDVRVKTVNKAKRYRMKLAVAGRDETWCPVIKPLNDSMLRG